MKRSETLLNRVTQKKAYELDHFVIYTHAPLFIWDFFSSQYIAFAKFMTTLHNCAVSPESSLFAIKR